MPYVLIVDDDKEFASAAAIVLRGVGLEVEIELDAGKAIERMEQRKPDLAILDVMFPESSSAGFDLARDIRKNHAKLKDVPIIMLTAVNERFPLGFSSNDIDEEWLPVEQFLEKPIEFEVLKERVLELLNEKKAACCRSKSDCK